MGTASVNYIFLRTNHQYLSRNINAPLPGTYDPADPSSGVRPMGGTQNIYQFSSGGMALNNLIFCQHQPAGEQACVVVCGGVLRVDGKK